MHSHRPSHMDFVSEVGIPASAHDLALTFNLTEPQIVDLLHRIAHHPRIALAYWSAWDVEVRLAANNGNNSIQRLTTAQWHQVTQTPAWRAVANLAYDNVADSGILTLAIRQAGLECITCGATLPTGAPTTQTWLRCDQCRNETTSDDILRRPCAADAAGHHQERQGHCALCGVPMPLRQQPSSSSAPSRGQDDPGAGRHPGIAREATQDPS